MGIGGILWDIKQLIVASSKLVCSVSKNNEFSPNRFVDEDDRIIDKNGNLSQSEILSAIKKANPNIAVKTDYFEKQLNESTLKGLKKDSTGNIIKAKDSGLLIHGGGWSESSLDNQKGSNKYTDSPNVEF